MKLEGILPYITLNFYENSAKSITFTTASLVNKDDIKMAKPVIKVFISYAHKDTPFFEVFRDGVKSQLSTSDKFDFNAWEDSEIPLGSNWDDEIKDKLGDAGIAILCVSANFLNSRYIAANEFGALVNQYPNTLVIPVYFNHCNMNAWQELARKQFFKPAGDDYAMAAKDDFAFCDLVSFYPSTTEPIPNSNIDLYLQDFVKKIENALLQHGSGGDDHDAGEEHEEKKIISGNNTAPQKEKSLTDKIVEGTIILAIVASLVFIFYTIAFNHTDTAQDKKFSSTIGCTMFFGSFASFIFNKKFQAR
jgi:hypothetical protein